MDATNGMELQKEITIQVGSVFSLFSQKKAPIKNDREVNVAIFKEIVKA